MLPEVLRQTRPTADRPLVVVTGAGVSASSGIPTFRGPEGYWTAGSRTYRPMELATQAAFQRDPREVWRWYLYRKAICNRADPNPAHDALVGIEAALGDAFWLVTQNVDGLHRRAGSSAERTCTVHGSIDQMRDLGTGSCIPIPEAAADRDRDQPLDDDRYALVRNPATGNRCRPHVLWFDEVYDEGLYRSDTAMSAASSASVLVVAGSSGAAALPMRAAAAAARAGAVIVDINPADNPFRTFCAGHDRGVVLDTDAVQGMAALQALWG